MEDRLRAGIAIYNDGDYHEAHDAWESHWLGLESGTDDEQFLHGLIQFTAAVHHGTNRNWAGLHGLATSAGEYLDGLPAEYHGVAIEPIRTYLASLEADPVHYERTPPPKLRFEGEVLTPDRLLSVGDFEATAIIATVLAEEKAAYDQSVIESAVEFARDSIAADDDGEFVALVFDFVSGGERDFVYQRLREHVSRRRQRARDVDGLFDPE